MGSKSSKKHFTGSDEKSDDKERWSNWRNKYWLY